MTQSSLDAHRATLESLERTHDRNVAQNDRVLDRFMALDFSLFKSHQLAESSEEGGFFAPDEIEEALLGTTTMTPGGNIVLHGEELQRRLKAAMEENQILAEDFPEG